MKEPRMKFLHLIFPIFSDSQDNQANQVLKKCL